ncbi:MAG: hypothetical protein E7240_09680 [Lachnospiraceae bacterium]|nr:hypothetical protein [Lachnospiraceae bacterium]
METLDQAYLNDLAEKTRGGSSNAFAELFAASGARQFSYLSGMLKREQGETARQTVLNALEDVYVTALHRIGTLSEPSLFMPWLSRISFQMFGNTSAEPFMHLPLTESQVLVMKDIQGLDTRRIGDILNYSDAEVRRYEKAGRRHLAYTRGITGTDISEGTFSGNHTEIRMKEDLSAAESASVLENIFEKSGWKPNTVPMEALASYALYRKERFSWQKRLTGAAMAVFVLLPLLFVLPRFTVTEAAEGERGLPVYTVQVRSVLPVGRVTARLRNHSLPVYEAGAKEFTVEPTRNGALTIRVELINRQGTESETEVTDVDCTGPALLDSLIGEDFFTLYVADEGIGVDYREIIAKNAAGEEIRPLEYNEEEGSVTFSYPEEDWDVYIPDHIGNTLHLALTLQQGQ